jgi:hypothetical protein
MTDQLRRELEARLELKRIDRSTRYWANERREALWALKDQLGTWQKVADATGQKLPAVTKAAYKRPREDQP